MSTQKEKEYGKLVKLSSDLLIMEQTHEKILSCRQTLTELQRRKMPFSVKPQNVPQQYEHQNALNKKYFSEYIRRTKNENLRQALIAEKKTKFVQRCILHPLNIFLHILNYALPILLFLAFNIFAAVIGLKYSNFIDASHSWGILFFKENFAENANENIAFYLILCLSSGVNIGVWIYYLIDDMIFDNGYAKALGITTVILSSILFLYAGAKWMIYIWNDEQDTSIAIKILLFIPLIIAMIISVIPRLVVSLLIYSLIPILLNLASIKLTNYIADSKWGINVNDFRIGFYHKTCKEMFKKDISAIYESSIYQNELKNAIEQDEILQKQLQNEQNVLYKKIKDEYSAYSNDYDAKLKIIQLNINDIEGQYIKAQKAVENNPCLHKDQKNIRFVSILLDLFTHMRASTIQEAVNIAKNDSDMEIFKGMFQNYHDKLLTIQKEYLSTMNNISEDIRDMRNMQRETLSCMQRIDNNTQIISGQLDFNTKAIINATKEQTNTLQNIGKNSNLSNEYLGQIRNWAEIDAIKKRNS